MAGSSVTITSSRKDINGIRNAEVLISLACLSDDTAGTIPATNLTGLGDYELVEVRPIPDGTVPPTSAFEIRIEDSIDEAIFLSGSIAVDSKAPIGGHNLLGWFPSFDDLATFKIVDPSDHTTQLDVGNEKKMTVVLRLKKKMT